MRDLHGQVAVITGGARGIGRAIAEVLAQDGASVVIADLNREAAEATASDLSAMGSQAFGVALDVTDRSSADAMAVTVIERMGRIDILAANAGVYPESALALITGEQWDFVMDVNVKGALYTIQACLPQMRDQGYGRIVLTSSITGPITGHPGLAHYGASKAAMLGLMRSAAIEVARQGITINAVLPGNIRTPGLDEMGEEHLRQMKAAIPLGELGDPADIGWAVRFLASPEARYISGHALVVDGGQVLPESPAALEQ
jgi:3-oxoacyl-[acyl-carrier protein] reductase